MDMFQLWMVVFPEGTRFNPELKEVIKKSQEYSRQQGTMIIGTTVLGYTLLRTLRCFLYVFLLLLLLFWGCFLLLSFAFFSLMLSHVVITVF